MLLPTGDSQVRSAPRDGATAAVLAGRHLRCGARGRSDDEPDPLALRGDGGARASRPRDHVADRLARPDAGDADGGHGVPGCLRRLVGRVGRLQRPGPGARAREHRRLRAVRRGAGRLGPPQVGRRADGAQRRWGQRGHGPHGDDARRARDREGPGHSLDLRPQRGSRLRHDERPRDGAAGHRPAHQGRGRTADRRARLQRLGHARGPGHRYPGPDQGLDARQGHRAVQRAGDLLHRPRQLRGDHHLGHAVRVRPARGGERLRTVSTTGTATSC